MATGVELRNISKLRLKSAKSLIDAGDWGGAAYMMGWTLECALKSVVCKTLHLAEYPEKREKDDWFVTHKLDRLLRISGLEDVFGSRGVGFRVWSDFTKDYEGEWPRMRYDVKKLNQFDRKEVMRLYDDLTSSAPGSEGILKLIAKKRRW